jgi:hypothetical protein
MFEEQILREKETCEDVPHLKDVTNPKFNELIRYLNDQIDEIHNRISDLSYALQPYRIPLEDSENICTEEKIPPCSQHIGDLINLNCRLGSLTRQLAVLKEELDL